MQKYVPRAYLELLVPTGLRAQASLVEDLLLEGYDYVVPRRFQSDPLENVSLVIVK